MKAAMAKKREEARNNKETQTALMDLIREADEYGIFD